MEFNASTQPAKRPVGRPPKYRGTNQYTGKRAENIEWVRQYLRKFLEAAWESRPLLEAGWLTDKETTARLKNAQSTWVRSVIVAVRMLLACEDVHIWQISPQLGQAKKKDAHDMLVNLGNGLKEGTVKMPDLLSQLNDIEKGLEDADV